MIVFIPRRVTPTTDIKDGFFALVEKEDAKLSSYYKSFPYIVFYDRLKILTDPKWPCSNTLFSRPATVIEIAQLKIEGLI